MSGKHLANSLRKSVGTGATASISTTMPTTSLAWLSLRQPAKHNASSVTGLTRQHSRWSSVDTPNLTYRLMWLLAQKVGRGLQSSSRSARPARLSETQRSGRRCRWTLCPAESSTSSLRGGATPPRSWGGRAYSHDGLCMNRVGSRHAARTASTRSARSVFDSRGMGLPVSGWMAVAS